MSASSMETSTTVESIVNAQVNLVRISTPILLIFGNIGEILNIIIFAQRNFRTNSCGIYFLAASCIRVVFIHFTILLNGLSFGYNISPASASIIFCKLKFYISTVSSILPSSFVILACLDRLMLSSSSAKVRSWSQPRFAYLLVTAVSIFWLIFSIHCFIGATILERPGYSLCYIEPGAYSLFVAINSITFHYLLPPILMIILGLLTIINVQRTQRRVRPLIGHGYSRRKDRHLLRMLLFQVLVNMIFVIPAGVFQLYKVVSANWQKDAFSQAWDMFYFVLALALFYIPNCADFYIYTLTTSIFRQELRRLVLQGYRQLFG